MKEKIDINTLLNKVEYKDLIKRYIMLIIALFISAVTYNVFFVKTGFKIRILGNSNRKGDDNYQISKYKEMTTDHNPKDDINVDVNVTGK